jgi:hypothetical protein
MYGIYEEEDTCMSYMRRSASVAPYTGRGQWEVKRVRGGGEGKVNRGEERKSSSMISMSYMRRRIHVCHI